MSQRLVLAMLSLLLSASVWVSSQQFPPIRSGVVLVPLDVRVVDAKGNPVKDLTASDFVVTEDDVQQEIAHFQTVDFAGGRAPHRLLQSIRSLPLRHRIAP